MPAKLVAGRYELRELLGEGGMGVVYRAIDTRTGGLVAIKTMRDISDPRTVDMFKKEWGVLARLSHPNIVDIRDVDEIEEDGVRKPCFVMPLLPGSTLAKLIKDSSPRLTVQRVVGMICQVCNGLEAAHKTELIHRDLKPSNIFVMDDDTAKIIDFGLVHSADSKSVTGYKGTWQYMAPEQTEGKRATALSDIYSLGVVAYEALTGRKPFARKTVEATVDAIREYIPPIISEINPKVSQLLSKAIHKAMAKQPMHRYTSAREFADTLQKAIHNQPIDRFDPVKILPRVERARKAFGKSDFAFASEILNELEAEGNVDPEITLLRAQIQEDVKQKKIGQLYEAAETRLEQDEIPLALDKLREILILEPENEPALAMRKRIEEQRNSQQISDWMKLAHQHLELHDFQDARQALKEVINIRYDDSDALQLLSEIDVQEKEAAKARAEKEQLYSSALKAYQGGEISSALSKLERILEISRRAPGATVPERDAVHRSFYNRVRSEKDSIDKGYEDGRRHLNQKEFQQALEVCDEMLAKYPGSAQFQALKIMVEQSERQELSAYIAEIGRSADAEPDLDRRVNILEEACKRYPKEVQFQQSLRLIREQRDLLHSILVKARHYEELSQFADAIAQWKILRSIHPQFPGIDFEIGQLEKRREQQAAEERKTRFVEQIDRAIENGVFANAVEAVEIALAEFPQDSELLVLERIARQGLDKVREAERLFEKARRMRAEARVDEAIELLRDAVKLDERNSGIRNALVSLLVERAHTLLNEDWRKSEALAQSAAELDEHHPAVKRLFTLIAETRRKDDVTQCIAEVRELQLSKDYDGAINRLEDGLSRHPGEGKLEQYRTNLQNARQQKEQRPDPSAQRGGNSAPTERLEAFKDEGLTGLYDRSEVLPNSLVENPADDLSLPEKANQKPISGVKAEPAAAVKRFDYAKVLARAVLFGAAAKSAVHIATAKALSAGSQQIDRLKAQRPLQSRNWRLGLAGAAAAILGLSIVLVARHYEKTQPAKVVARVSSEMKVSITTVPGDAALTVDGKTRTERTLVLDSSKTHEATVARLGYKTKTVRTLHAQSGGWVFNLEPEPVHIQILTSQRSGKVSLDGKEMWDLKQGDLIDYELPPDDGQHTLIARNKTGELLRVSFEAPVGASPRVARLATPELMVSSSLGNGATVFSGSLPKFVALPEQKPQEIVASGTAIDLKGADPEQISLTISDSKGKKPFALLHGNAPALCVALNANPNLGSLTVTTAVQGAHLFFDQKEKPTKKPGYWHFSTTAGAHDVRLVAAGYEDVNQTIKVEKGQDLTQPIQMNLAPATLVVQGGTPGAEILIDGIRKATLDAAGTAQIRMPIGMQTIEVRKENFEGVTLPRLFSAGQTITLKSPDVTLKAFGALVFEVTPATAVVQYRRTDESDWHQPTSASVSVKSGSYEVKADADNKYFPENNKPVSVPAGETVKVEIAFKPKRHVPEPTTPDFFRNPSGITQANHWYTGGTSNFVELKTSSHFAFTFLRPEKVPSKHKAKRLEWRVTIYPDVELDYELEGQQLTRKVKSSERIPKSTTKGEAADGDSAYSVKVVLEPHRVLIESKNGKVLDEFDDSQHDWSHAVVAIRGDQYFVVSGPPSMPKS